MKSRQNHTYILYCNIDDRVSLRIVIFIEQKPSNFEKRSLYLYINVQFPVISAQPIRTIRFVRKQT